MVFFISSLFFFFPLEPRTGFDYPFFSLSKGSDRVPVLFFLLTNKVLGDSFPPFFDQHRRPRTFFRLRPTFSFSFFNSKCGAVSSPDQPKSVFFPFLRSIKGRPQPRPTPFFPFCSQRDFSPPMCLANSRSFPPPFPSQGKLNVTDFFFSKIDLLNKHANQPLLPVVFYSPPPSFAEDFFLLFPPFFFSPCFEARWTPFFSLKAALN